jgi:hypothetical protein
MAAHIETPSIRRFERLAFLNDHRVAKGMIDPRGWKVLDGHGQSVGEVKDLIVDTDRMVADFIDVELDQKFFHIVHTDPRILVPMHQAHRDGDARRLIVYELTRSRVATLLLARDERQLEFWREWWHSRDALEEPIEPVPPAYVSPSVAETTASGADLRAR